MEDFAGSLAGSIVKALLGEAKQFLTFSGPLGVAVVLGLALVVGKALAWAFSFKNLKGRLIITVLTLVVASWYLMLPGASSSKKPRASSWTSWLPDLSKVGLPNIFAGLGSNENDSGEIASADSPADENPEEEQQEELAEVAPQLNGPMYGGMFPAGGMFPGGQAPTYIVPPVAATFTPPSPVILPGAAVIVGPGNPTNQNQTSSGSQPQAKSSTGVASTRSRSSTGNPQTDASSVAKLPPPSSVSQPSVQPKPQKPRPTQPKTQNRRATTPSSVARAQSAQRAGSWGVKPYVMPYQGANQNGAAMHHQPSRGDVIRMQNQMIRQQWAVEGNQMMQQMHAQALNGGGMGPMGMPHMGGFHPGAAHVPMHLGGHR